MIAREDYLLREQDLTDRIVERDQAIAKLQHTLAERDLALASKDKEITRLKALLSEKAL